MSYALPATEHPSLDHENLPTLNVCAGVTTQIPDPEMSSFTLLTMAEKALDEARAQGGDRAVYLPAAPDPDA